jgi:2',3'-cyclic-nucleotide 2'-phosphodiesterase (5'-nucleotidase family)
VFYTLADVKKAVADQLARRNLAAVLIQLNDTYLIEAREQGSGIPGMPRLARFIAEIRKLVNGSLRSDRTLVLHAGDYLGPSLMSCSFHGLQMVDLLAHCNVRFAAIGNHEFDFGRKGLRESLSTATFQTISANLSPPTGDSTCRVEPLAFWPRTRPFLAITGLAGKQTQGKALENGWTVEDPKATIERIIQRVTPDPAIRGLVILTHMDRDEDLDLCRFLQSCWPPRGAVHIIAGHDHDIHWAEPRVGRVFLSKSLSNAKSVTVILIPRDFLASLGWPPPAIEPRLTAAEVAWRERVEERPFQARADYERKFPPPKVKGRCRTIHQVIRAYRSVVPIGVRREFRLSFERRLRQIYSTYFEGSSEESIRDGLLGHEVVEYGEMSARSDVAEAFYGVSGKELFEHVEPDPAAERRVRYWRHELQKVRPMPDDIVVSELGCPQRGSGATLDVTDDNLRTRSTDFGNFAADALKQGAQSDIALINAGSFRFDGEIPCTVMLSHLYDVFLYDGPFTKDEIVSLYDHAMNRGGHGAFLQVSESDVTVRKRSEKRLNVALIKHMITDPEDGFLGLLAGLRRVSESTLCRQIADASRYPGGSLIQMIQQGCQGGSVTYSDELRIVAHQSESEGDAVADLVTRWKTLTQHYDELCGRVNVFGVLRLDILMHAPSVIVKSTEPFDRALDQKLFEIHVGMLDFVRSLAPDKLERLKDQLVGERLPPEEREVFVKYLDAVYEHLHPTQGVFF